VVALSTVLFAKSLGISEAFLFFVFIDSVTLSNQDNKSISKRLRNHVFSRSKEIVYQKQQAKLR